MKYILATLATMVAVPATAQATELEDTVRAYNRRVIESWPSDRQREIDAVLAYKYRELMRDLYGEQWRTTGTRKAK